MITFEQFKAMDIRIARVLEVIEHPDADKLYILTIDTGGKAKKIVAGIRKYYSKEELTGRYIVIIDNIQPVTIRGIVSEAMLLAAKDENTIALIAPDKVVKTGSPVS